jgi:hypothetical protein
MRQIVIPRSGEPDVMQVVERPLPAPSAGEVAIDVIYSGCNWADTMMPEIFTGLRVGVGIGWSSLVAAELIASRAGLGWMSEIAGRELQVAYIFIGIVLIGCLSYLIDLCVRVIEHFAVPWRTHSGM